MDFQYCKTFQKALEENAERASLRLKAFPADGPMGLVRDEVKFSPQYREAKKTFDEAFAKLRAYNLRFTKAFASELRAERRARRAG